MFGRTSRQVLALFGSVAILAAPAFADGYERAKRAKAAAKAAQSGPVLAGGPSSSSAPTQGYGAPSQGYSSGENAAADSRITQSGGMVVLQGGSVSSGGYGSSLPGCDLNAPLVGDNAAACSGQWVQADRQGMTYSSSSSSSVSYASQDNGSYESPVVYSSASGQDSAERRACNLHDFRAGDPGVWCQGGWVLTGRTFTGSSQTYAAAPQFAPAPQPQFAPQPQYMPAPQPQYAPAPQYMPAPQPQYAPAPQYMPAPQPQFIPAPQPQFVPAPQPQFVPAPQAQSVPLDGGFFVGGVTNGAGFAQSPVYVGSGGSVIINERPAFSGVVGRAPTAIAPPVQPPVVHPAPPCGGGGCGGYGGGGVGHPGYGKGGKMGHGKR